MKLRKIGAFGAALVVLAALIGFFVTSANAATQPPWEPDANALGTITFYDANGNVVTGGSDLTNMWAYAAGSTNSFQGASILDQFTKAQIEYSWANSVNPTINWFTKAPYASTSFPVTGAGVPTVISTSDKAVVNSTGTGTSSNFGAIENSGTNDTTAGYSHMIQVRLVALGPGGVTTTPNYWATDISFDPTAGTWTQVYPAAPAGPTATTTTTPTATPASPQALNTNITFHATVSPNTAAGKIQFLSDGTNLGTPQTVTSGAASLATTALTAGTHSITAQFIPTDSTAFGGSTSPSGLSYTITSPATPTTTQLTTNPTSPITVGTSTTLNAQVMPSTAVGNVQFKDGSTNLGSPVAVSGGAASLPGQSFTLGTHSLTAQFIPTNSANFSGSTSSPALSFVVNPQPATPTTTGMTVTQTSPQQFGTNLTFNATVTPSNAVGTVHFFDGGTDVAHATVSGGTASVGYAGLSVATHSLTAQFQPTTPADFGSSTSTPAISYTISPAASTLSLGVSPTTSAKLGSMVTVTATVGPTGVGGGSVQFKYLPGDVNIGAAQPVNATTEKATVSTSTLPVTTTGIEAIFTPSSSNYSASSNQSISYSILPADTAVALSVTPNGQAVEGTQETLTAAVTPATATGSVQFFDGANMLGSPVTVSSGSASLPQTLSLGSHTLTAMFMTGDSSSFNSSPTSNSVSYTVIAPPTSTTTTVAVAPGSTEPYGTELTFTATVSPSAAGTVTFKDGSTTLGTAPTVAGDTGATATLSTIALHGGSHDIVASFVATSQTAFTNSQGDVSVTISTVATTTSLAVSPTGPVGFGTSVTLTATVSPANAVGSVTFFNGTTNLGSAAVTGGVATLHTTKIAVGDAMLSASFAATHSSDFAASSSESSSLTVVALPVISTVFDNGKKIGAGGNVQRGATVQIHATGFQPGESVKIYLHSTPVLLATVNATAAGDVIANVVIPTSTTLGKHAIVLVGSLGSVSFAVTVVAASTGGSGGSGSGGIANTGVDVQYGIVLGVLLLAAGGALMGGVRFRRRGATE